MKEGNEESDISVEHKPQGNLKLECDPSAQLFG